MELASLKKSQKLLLLFFTDFISGWLQDGVVHGRPSAPLVMSDGSLLISDDKANLIFRVSYNEQKLN